MSTFEARQCVMCGEVIPRRPRVNDYMYAQSKYCSDKCKKANWVSGSGLNLACGTVGALSELVACADLLRRGYEVFRSVSPNCSCDILAQKNGNTLRVEVRSGVIPNGTTLSFAYNNRKDAGRSDVIAVVIGGVNVIYCKPGTKDPMEV